MVYLSVSQLGYLWHLGWKNLPVSVWCVWILNILVSSPLNTSISSNCTRMPSEVTSSQDQNHGVQSSSGEAICNQVRTRQLTVLFLVS